MGNDFWQVQIATNADQADIIEDLLWELNALSVTLVDGANNPIFEPNLGTTPIWQNTNILALFALDAQKDDISMVFNKLNLSYKFTYISDQNWERAWLNDFKPMQFGVNLWIVPSAYSPPNPCAVNLYLDPGLAFGTGTHPSTSLCLKWLDANASYLRNKSIIDYGCGSGVLAIAAILLGAKHAIGVDIDIQALVASRSNAKNNNIADEQLKLYLAVSSNNKEQRLVNELCAINGNLNNLTTINPCDVVIANILATPLILLAPMLAKLVNPSGYLVVAGILDDQINAVANAFKPFTRDEIKISKQDNWACLSMQIISN